MNLLFITTTTISGSSTKTANLIGTTTDDIYFVTITNASSTTNDDQIMARVLVSGSADTDSNYDNASKNLIDNEGFSNGAQSNQNSFRDLMYTGDQTGETNQANFYLYNFNSSSKYSYISYSVSGMMHTPRLYGAQGGGFMTEAQSCNGIQFYANSGNLTDGSKFTLYKVVS